MSVDDRDDDLVIDLRGYVEPADVDAAWAVVIADARRAEADADDREDDPMPLDEEPIAPDAAVEPRAIVPRPIPRPRDAYGAVETLGDDGEWTDGAHVSAVAYALEQLRIRDEARRLYAAEMASDEPFDAGTLAEVLARDPEPPMRIEGVLPASGSLLLIAVRKAGKTTLSLGAARSFVTGEPFLGQYTVRTIAPDARVGFLNFEVSGATFGKWADEAGVPRDRLYVVNLRGRRTPFASDADLARLAALLREARVAVLILDPFGRAFPGESQDNNSEVSRFLDRLDAWARTEVGVSEIVLTAHAGHSGDHVRGASVLEGWSDVNVFMTKQGTTRYFRAEGRDVEVRESALAFDPATRQLTIAGGSRADTAQNAALELIERMLADSPAVGLSGRAIEDALDGMVERRKVREALDYGQRVGRLSWQLGAKRAHIWSVVPLPELYDDRNGSDANGDDDADD